MTPRTRSDPACCGLLPTAAITRPAARRLHSCPVHLGSPSQNRVDATPCRPGPSPWVQLESEGQSSFHDDPFLTWGAWEGPWSVQCPWQTHMRVRGDCPAPRGPACWGPRLGHPPSEVGSPLGCLLFALPLTAIGSDTYFLLLLGDLNYNALLEKNSLFSWEIRVFLLLMC